MATGSYDENGFYSYGEDDLADPGQGFSELLNKSSNAVKEAVPVLVHNRVIDELTDDPTIRQAATAAVEEEVTSRDLVEGDDPRLLEASDPKAFRVRDSGSNKVALAVTPNRGQVYAPDLYTRLVEMADGSATSDTFPGVRYRDRASGRVAFQIDPLTGRVYIGDLDPRSAGAPVARVVVLWAFLQSNTEGRGRPYGGRLDREHPRILQALWTGTAVTGMGPATVPLSSQNQQLGMSPLTVIARRIVEAEPDTAVVILNTARGGAGVVTDSTNGVWGVGYTGPNTPLLPIAKNALTALLAKVRAYYPGRPVDVQAVAVGGETDAAQPYSVYSPALLALVDELRAFRGDATMPVVFGGTVPEVTTATEYANIMRAQIDMQAQRQYVAFAAGVPNGGGSGDVTDTVHYSRQAVERLGTRMYEALRRAYINTTGGVPYPPLDITARWRKTAGQLDISWSFPFCRATAFTVQYSVDGGAWTAVSGRPIELDPTATVTGLSTGAEVRVRVSTTNEGGTSAFTTPVVAIGA